MVPDADLRIKLPVFEGPLDLLLFLIRKNELDIYDIPIATVTRQYIEVIRSMRELDLDIAGEFFVMAASLMEIKSRMLLPRGQAAVSEGEDDDPLDPRWELVHQLLQYKKFKEAAAKLDELAGFQRDMLTRRVFEVAVTENERPLKPVDRIELWNSFNLVLRRLAEKLVVGEIKGEEVTVSDKMEELLELIRTRKKFLFTDLFEGQPVTIRVLVATFIAVLELTRLKKLRVRQDEAYTDIHVEAVEETLAEMIPPAEPPVQAVTYPPAEEGAIQAALEEIPSAVATTTANDDEATDDRRFAFVPTVIAAEIAAETPPESAAETLAVEPDVDAPAGDASFAVTAGIDSTQPAADEISDTVQSAAAAEAATLGDEIENPLEPPPERNTLSS